jgi:hypothetical protein
MDTNRRQIALSLFESLRSDLLYAHLKNGSRIPFAPTKRVMANPTSKLQAALGREAGEKKTSSIRVRYPECSTLVNIRVREVSGPVILQQWMSFSIRG